MPKNFASLNRLLICGFLCLLFVWVLPGVSSRSDTSRSDLLRADQARQPRQLAGAFATARNGAAPMRSSLADLRASRALRAAATAPLAALVSATKSYQLDTDVDGDTKADPGDTLKYTVTITNSGSDPATDVMFSDTIDPNTTLVPGSVVASPVAANDAYQTIGNVHIQVPVAQGVIANDVNPGGGTLAVTQVNATAVPGGGSASASTANGSVTMSSDGSFTYTPNAGFTGATDSFTYTLGNGSGMTDTATVTINVSGMIWFVDDNAAAGGNGTLASPYNCLVGVGCFDPAANDQAGDNIFLFSGNYTGGLTLLNNQRLIGQGAPDSILTITGLPTPSGNNLLPATNGTDPVITTSGTTAITLGQDNQLHGFTVGDTTAAGTDISGNGFGTLTVKDVTVNGTGQALNLANGTIAAGSTFAAVESVGSVNQGVLLDAVGGSLMIASTTVTNATGIGILAQNLPLGASVNFGNTSITNPDADTIGNTGVRLIDNAGNVSFGQLNITPENNQRALHATNGVANSGTITTTSGTITASGAPAVEIDRTSAGTIPLVMSLTSVSASGGVNGLILDDTSGSFTVTGDGATANSGGTIQNTTGHAVTLTRASGVTLKFMRILQPGANNAANVGASGILATNLSGTNFVEKSTIEYGATAITSTFALRMDNTSTNGSLTLDASTIQNKSDGTAAISISAKGNSQITFNVQDSNTADAFDMKLTNLFGSGIIVGAGDDAGSTATVNVAVSNAKFINAAANGVNNLEMIVQQSAVLNYNVSNNTFDTVGRSSFITGVINVNATGGGRIGSVGNPATIDGNTIQNIGISSAAPGYVGIRIAPDNSSAVTHKVIISNNIIKNVWRQGILLSGRSQAVVNARINNNTIGTLAEPVGRSNRRGVEVETQQSSTMNLEVKDNPSIVGAGTSNTNSALHLRSGTDTPSNAAINATVTNNTIKNSASAGTGGWFRAETVALAPGPANMCLDLRNNVLRNSGDAADGTKEFNLLNNGLGGSTFNLNQSGNTGTITSSGTIGSTGSCTAPNLLSMPADVAAAGQGVTDQSVSLDGSLIMNQMPDNGDRLSETQVAFIVQAALTRWREMGSSAEDMARLEAVRFEISDLPEGQVAVPTTSGARLDVTAAGHGWYYDTTPMEDGEFAVPVQGTHYEALDISPAYGRVDLLTVVMRELGRVYLQGKTRVPKNLRSLMAPTLSPSVRRLPLSLYRVSVPLSGSVIKSPTDSGSLAQAGGSVRSYAFENSRPAIAQSNAEGFLMGRSLRHAALNPADGYTASDYLASRALRVGTLAPSGETVSLNIGTLPAGKSVTIMFRVMINNSLPSGVCSVTNQAHVTGSNFSPVDTNSVVTPVDRPVAISACPADIATNADNGQCTAQVTYAVPTASGCPAPTVTCNPASGSAFSKGVTTVTCTASNGSSPDATCTFTVTVSDNQAPQVACPASFSQSTDANACTAVVTYATPTATDNCSGVGAVTCTPASGTAFPKGVSTVTCSVTDASGNAGSCSFTVTVNDTQAPTITCPASSVHDTDPNVCTAVVTYAAPTVSDNCPGAGSPTCSPASGSSFPRGVTTVNCSVTDASGNSASCSFTVTVRDTQAPTISACPANISTVSSGGCEVITYTSPTATDNCGSATVTCTPPSGFCFPAGTTTVTCTASDSSPDSPDSSCSFTVTVVPCTISCPANITVGNDPNQCGAVVSFSPTTSAGCGTVACSPASGSFFPVGTMTVTCTTQTGPACSFSVTVKDTQAPTIGACPANISVVSGGACQVVNYTPPTASDNCGSASVACTPPSGFCFPSGTTPVTCVASDSSPDSPNSSCSFTVTVVPCTISCPANITVGNDPNQCGAVVNFAPSVNGGGCGTVVCSPASGSFFPVGTVTVTCTTQAGPACSFSVTVQDTQAPTITVTTQTIELWPPNHQYETITMSQLLASATDNCSGNLFNSVVIASVSSDEPENGGGDGNTVNDIVIAGNCKSVQLRAERQGGGNGRVYTIVLRVKDAAGNVTTASRTVTVPANQGHGAAIAGPGPGYTVNGTCP
ncbi:MAG TPA: HYR domain-containing protein [Blastocatellia bacterium]|nr:HYR domain-containing protein [Blastocatellia bacterium]